MLDLTKIEDNVTIELMGPDDKLVGIIENELTFNNVRLQICEQNLSGYYFIYEGKSYKINRFGAVLDWPCGLFTRSWNIPTKILTIALNRKKNEKN